MCVCVRAGGGVWNEKYFCYRLCLFGVAVRDPESLKKMKPSFGERDFA